MKGKIPKGRILVKKQEEEKEKVVNGIIVPVNTTTQKKADVVIGGEQVKEGDVITYKTDKARAVEVNIEGEDYLLMTENDVLYID